MRATSFVDAKNTSKDSALLGPPSLEFAPFGKVAAGRVRKDPRQGTIDQDIEFIEFLESLTNPIVKPTVDLGADGEGKEDKVTVTPLIQFIKDKKANKNKANENSKTSKQAKTESKDGKSEKVQAKKVLSRSGKEAPPVTERSAKAEKSGKGGKETSKQAQAAATKAATPAKTIAQTPPKAATPAPAAERKRERGNASIAAQILQRDLGLSNGGARNRRGGRNAGGDGKATPTEAGKTAPGAPETLKATPASDKAAAPKSSTPKPESPAAPAATTNNRQNKRGQGKAQPQPATSTSTQEATPTAPTSTTPQPSKSNSRSQPQAKANPVPAATSTQAFLKHANPSQGVTEALLETTFATFGKVLKVEIDKKKGFGYVDFEEHDGLKKAMAASPVKIAQGSVVVLERKSGAPVAQARGRGGAAKGNATAATNSPAATAAASSTAAAPNTTEPAVTTNASPSTPTTPTSAAPAKSANAGNRSHRRGGRGRAGRGGGNNPAGGEKAAASGTSGAAASAPAPAPAPAAASAGNKG